MNYALNVIYIALIFYLLDYIWRNSKAFKKISSIKVLNKKLIKVLLIILSIILIIACIYLNNILSTYLLEQNIISLIIKGISLIILYFVTSLIFINKTNNKKEVV